jgi:hypothetical protein
VNGTDCNATYTQEMEEGDNLRSSTVEDFINEIAFDCALKKRSENNNRLEFSVVGFEYESNVDAAEKTEGGIFKTLEINLKII